MASDISHTGINYKLIAQNGAGKHWTKGSSSEQVPKSSSLS